MGIVRVFIIDPDGALRSRLRQTLETSPAIEIVGEAGDYYAALEKMVDVRPHVIIVGDGLPDVQKAAVRGALRFELPEAGIIELPAVSQSAVREAVSIDHGKIDNETLEDGFDRVIDCFSERAL